jgi:hypothetical protein
MPQKLDYDRVASILVEAAYYGEQSAAARWGISDRTILNYRNRLNEDEELSDIFALKKAAFENEWANEVPAAIRSALRFIVRAGEEANPKDPEAIHAVAGALKIVSEVELTREIINARLGRHDRPNREEGRQMVALSSGEENRDS